MKSYIISEEEKSDNNLTTDEKISDKKRIVFITYNKYLINIYIN